MVDNCMNYKETVSTFIKTNIINNDFVESVNDLITYRFENRPTYKITLERVAESELTLFDLVRILCYEGELQRVNIWDTEVSRSRFFLERIPNVYRFFICNSNDFKFNLVTKECTICEFINQLFEETNDFYIPYFSYSGDGICIRLLHKSLLKMLLMFGIDCQERIEDRYLESLTYLTEYEYLLFRRLFYVTQIFSLRLEKFFKFKVPFENMLYANLNNVPYDHLERYINKNCQVLTPGYEIYIMSEDAFLINRFHPTGNFRNYRSPFKAIFRREAYVNWYTRYIKYKNLFIDVFLLHCLLKNHVPHILSKYSSNRQDKRVFDQKFYSLLDNIHMQEMDRRLAIQTLDKIRNKGLRFQENMVRYRRKAS